MIRGPRAGLLVAMVWLALGATCTVGCWVASTSGEWLQSISVVMVFALASRFWAIPSIGWAWLLSRAMSVCLVIGAASLVRSPGWGSRAISGGDIWFTVVAAILVGVTVHSRRGAVREVAQTMLVPPVPCGRWVVGEGETKAFNHHWVAPEQRAALDLVRVQRLTDGLGGRFSSFGQPLTSPVDGVVVEAVDGLADGGSPGRGEAAGNHVVIRTSAGEQVLLAHLRRGTVQVRTGDTVGIGAPLGEVGNSGNSTEPHLHIHVVSAEGHARRIRFTGDHGPFRKGDVIRFADSVAVAASSAYR